MFVIYSLLFYGSQPVTNDRRQTDSESYRFEDAQRKFGHMQICSDAFVFGLHKGESEGVSISGSALLGLQSQEKHHMWLVLPLRRKNYYTENILPSGLLCLCIYPTLIFLCY